MNEPNETKLNAEERREVLLCIRDALAELGLPPCNEDAESGEVFSLDEALAFAEFCLKLALGHEDRADVLEDELLDANDRILQLEVLLQRYTEIGREALGNKRFEQSLRVRLERGQLRRPNIVRAKPATPIKVKNVG